MNISHHLLHRIQILTAKGNRKQMQQTAVWLSYLTLPGSEENTSMWSYKVANTSMAGLASPATQRSSNSQPLPIFWLHKKGASNDLYLSSSTCSMPTDTSHSQQRVSEERPAHCLSAGK